MLVVINGVDTINKKFFAKEITEELNNFTIDGYIVDTILNPWGLRDPVTNEIVLHLDEENPVTTLIEVNQTFDENGNQIEEVNTSTNILRKLQILEMQFFDKFEMNHYKQSFVDIEHDYQLGPANLHTVKKQKPAGYMPGTDDNSELALTYDSIISYDNVIRDYNLRTFDIVAITGTFSKIFIDKITEDLGEDNVLVINIIRNPSTAFLLTQQTDQYYEEHTYYNKENDNKRLVSSILASAAMKDYKNVITIKFEDIIKDGRFYIKGIEIPAPPGYEPFNSYVTNWENDKILSLNLVDNNSLDTFNNNISDFFTVEKLKMYRERDNLEWSDEKIDQLITLINPKNMFTALEYTPLTREQIEAE